MPRIRRHLVQQIALPRSFGKYSDLSQQAHLSAINSKSIAILSSGFKANARK